MSIRSKLATLERTERGGWVCPGCGRPPLGPPDPILQALTVPELTELQEIVEAARARAEAAGHRVRRCGACRFELPGGPRPEQWMTDLELDRCIALLEGAERSAGGVSA